MLSRSLLVGALAAALLLTACTGPAPAATDAASAPSASPSASETAVPVPATLVISLTEVTLLNDDDSVAEQAALADGPSVLTLLTELFGTTPAVPNTNGYPIVSYDWGDVNLNVVDGGWSSIWVGTSALAGLAIRTTDGIAVGSPRTAVEALPVFDPNHDFDGDGESDYYGLEAVTNPDQQSLESPGQPGTDYVMVNMTGDTVASIAAPSSDYGDL